MTRINATFGPQPEDLSMQTSTIRTALPPLHSRVQSVRDRSAPIHMPRDLAGHMPDPRPLPKGWAQTRIHPRYFIIALQFAACAAFVAMVWWALS